LTVRQALANVPIDAQRWNEHATSGLDPAREGAGVHIRVVS
jgi:hypothetical protein